jgi:iron complex outermembrane receptor protein
MDRASRVIGVVFVLFGAIPALAQDDNDFKFFEEEARVVTPARREEPISDAPVAVEVVTPEEIAASGSDNLWDLLRYRPGMNVIDGHTPHAMRAIVSIRGFAEGFARNVLVLVDGRNAYSSNGGGVFWSQLPVQLQDVERIEIIRGPNAALYGTGAGLGVINIITKKPAGRLAGAVRGSGGNRGAVGSAECVFRTKPRAISEQAEGRLGPSRGASRSKARG